MNFAMSICCDGQDLLCSTNLNFENDFIADNIFICTMWSLNTNEPHCFFGILRLAILCVDGL